MGKWTDKDYITHSEWAQGRGGAKRKRPADDLHPLPFNCCALTLQPFTHPVCTPDGYVFDLEAIVPYLRRYGKNPATGLPLDTADLIPIAFDRNADGEMQCPVTLRTFTESSHIVVNRKSGHVYSHEAIERFNVDTKHWLDFFTEKPFTREDLIVLQDPRNLAKRNMADFEHVKHHEATPDKTRVRSSSTLERTLRHIGEKTTISTGKAAASLTSTSMTPVTAQTLAVVGDEEHMFQQIREPSKVALRTSLGDLVFELHSQRAPRTCYNFLQLARRGYYHNTRFHRLVPGFVVQGGDPTGTGAGGQSCWGRPFDNEFARGLTHAARGVLAMANKGRPKTNTSQFYISFQQRPELDRVHPVFGRLITGAHVLDAIEAVPVDPKTSRPLTEIVLEEVVVLEDAFERFQKRTGEPSRKRAQIDPYLLVKQAQAVSHTPATVGRYLPKPT